MCKLPPLRAARLTPRFANANRLEVWGYTNFRPPARTNTSSLRRQAKFRVAAISNRLVFLLALGCSHGTGIGFDSSTGFILRNGAERSPDAAWVKLEKWNRLTPQQQEKFAPICPDFVVELRSLSDKLKPLKTKMQEYIENGALLGLLIDRKKRRVYIYSPGVSVECLDNPATVSGDPVLPGFVLDLSKIW